MSEYEGAPFKDSYRRQHLLLGKMNYCDILQETIRGTNEKNNSVALEDDMCSN